MFFLSFVWLACVWKSPDSTYSLESVNVIVTYRVTTHLKKPEKSFLSWKVMKSHEKQQKYMKKKHAKTWKVMKNRNEIKNYLHISLKTCSPRFTFIILFLIRGFKKNRSRRRRSLLWLCRATRFCFPSYRYHFVYLIIFALVSYD